MRKMFKKEIGITLVALVITIILLLILAGISISQLTGSGLFENAKLAEQKSKDAQEKEEGILIDYKNQIGQYIDSNRDTTEEKTIAVDIITPNTASANWVKVADYPSGYTYDNCHIMNGYIQRTDDKLVIPTTYDEHWTILLRTTENGIEMSMIKGTNTTVMSMVNCPGKIYLQKD